MGCCGVFDKLYRMMREKLSSASEDDPNPEVRCTYCTRKERLVDFDNLNPGDHISMGGKNLMFNVGVHQIAFYQHHAIVKDVEKVNNTLGKATLIHFYSLSFDEAIQIRVTQELLDLQYYEIYKVRYCHGTHRPEKIIERAESLAHSDKKYKLMSCNCEHFCHWCCIGNAESYQVNDLFSVLRQIGMGTLNLGGKIGKVVANIIMVSLDDIAKAGWKGACCIGVPWGILSVFALAYLIYCIYRHHCLNRDKALGQVCARCCTQEKMDLWLKFFVYCSTQAGGIGLLSLVVAAGASMGVVAGCVAVISILSITLMWGIPKLKNSLRSPFKGKMVKVKTTDNIWIGDVISFQYGLKMHDGIVSKVKKLKGSSKKAKLSVIHYSAPSVFGRRIVREETLDIDLHKDVIKGHDYSGYDVHPPEKVVQRARQRLGETKFGIFSNRSCHFCHWAKVNEDVDDAPQENPVPTPVLQFERSIKLGEDISALQQVNVDHRRNRKHATKTMDKTWARIPQDVKEGSVIQFQYGRLGLWHFAVTTEVQYTEEPSSKLSVTVVHYGENSRPCEERFDFDLRHDDIWIYKYHPIYRYSRKDVVRRARARIGKGDYNILYQRSSHLAKEIVKKEEDERVTNFDMLSPGDTVIFYYWSLKHAAIVTNIGDGDSKGNNRTRVRIIHYALDTLFSKRTIKEEAILMDLLRDHVYRRNYEDITYPPERVIRRARSRLHEQRFSINGNTSWDLVHWAKVVQSPAIVKKSFNDDTVKSPPTDENIALLPLVGKVYDHFQKVPIQAWRDLQPGIIIEYNYYWIPHQAIITDVDYLRKKITVIHYGTNTIFSTRTIMKDTIRVDLRHDDLAMYRCDPTRCNRPELIVAKAYERLGEQKWGKNNKSWNFCVDCVLKKRPRSLDGD